MRLQYLSDLHLEFGDMDSVRPVADVVVLAGDIWTPSRGRPARAVEWVRDSFPGHQVVQVAGNHDFYGGVLGLTDLKLAEAASRAGVHWLECSEVTLSGVRFLGCTLWTDYALFGDPGQGMRDALAAMNDYRRIRVAPRMARVTPSILAALHSRSVRWLAECLHAAPAVPTVIVTHTAPSLRSIATAMRSDPVSVAYASDLEWLMGQGNVRAWVHGHTHIVADYHIGPTRVVSNPRGYTDAPVAGFDPEACIEVS